jgi:hypothetical protein
LRLPRLWRVVVGDPLQWHGGGREEEELQLWGISAGFRRGKWVGAFWRETKLMAGNYPSCGRHRGPARHFARFCFVRSPPSAPRKAEDGLGSPNG